MTGSEVGAAYIYAARCYAEVRRLGPPQAPTYRVLVECEDPPRRRRTRHVAGDMEAAIDAAYQLIAQMQMH